MFYYIWNDLLAAPHESVSDPAPGVGGDFTAAQLLEKARVRVRGLVAGDVRARYTQTLTYA